MCTRDRFVVSSTSNTQDRSSYRIRMPRTFIPLAFEPRDFRPNFERTLHSPPKRPDSGNKVIEKEKKKELDDIDINDASGEITIHWDRLTGRENFVVDKVIDISSQDDRFRESQD